jgi:hypothetical protein
MFEARFAEKYRKDGPISRFRSRFLLSLTVS